MNDRAIVQSARVCVGIPWCVLFLIWPKRIEPRMTSLQSHSDSQRVASQNLHFLRTEFIVIFWCFLLFSFDLNFKNCLRINQYHFEMLFKFVLLSGLLAICSAQRVIDVLF